MTALLPSDAANAGRIKLLYDHFRSQGLCELGASNLALATIQAGLEAVKPGEVLTVAEAAERLKLCEDIIYDLCNSGRLHSMKISSGVGKRPAIRIPLSSLLAFQQENAAPAGTPAGVKLRHLKIRQ
jgi:hypothetical protein